MSFPIPLNNSASVVVSQYSIGTTPFELVINKQSTFIENRVLYCKEANGGTMPRYLTLTGAGYTFQGCNTLYCYSNDAIQIHLSTNTWNILGGFSPSGTWDCNYPGTPTPFPKSFSTLQAPSNSLIVNPTMNNSQLFVDLRAQSKTIVLPKISNLVATSTLVPFYTIKDLYGNAQANSLFLSTSAGDILESPDTCLYATRINCNYASIDILPNGTNNTWHILNYYNGSNTPADTNLPTNNTFAISSAVTYVDTLASKKVVLLPPTSEVKDISFYVKDYTGTADTYPIYISTQMNDYIEGSNSCIWLKKSSESIRLVSPSTSLYSITLNYPWGVLPFNQR